VHWRGIHRGMSWAGLGMEHGRSNRAPCHTTPTSLARPSEPFPPARSRNAG
jgi:hypothetical protein